MSSSLMEKLRKFFEENADRYSVRWALLFGSQLSRPGPLSDVDLMVKFGRKLKPYELGELVAELEALLKKRVDLVDFDRAPPSLRYEAMKGIKIFVKDRNEFVEDFVKSVDEWLDFKPHWERMARAYLAKSRRGEEVL